MADPTRLSILRALMVKEKNVRKLVTQMGQSQANIPKYLKMLADARIVRRRKEGLQVYDSVRDALIEVLCRLVCVAILEEV